jgi:hypothetical protein
LIHSVKECYKRGTRDLEGLAVKLAALVFTFAAVAVAQPIDPEVILEKYPNLSLEIRPVPGDDVQMEPVQCDVYFMAGMARVYRNGKLVKKAKLEERMDVLSSKLKNAAESKLMRFSQPGIIGPSLHYKAFHQNREVTLEHHHQRGSLFNDDRDAQALQDLLFDLCQ